MHGKTNGGRGRPDHHDPLGELVSVDVSNRKLIDTTKTKFIFITGGVISSLGKGVAGASLGALLKGKGLKVSMQKLDPYLNTDAGTMNPQQHGEVYVTDDGAETDMDLGHYERFLNSNLPPHSCFTSGYIYTRVIEKEREGKLYEGRTIQIVPHITDMIKHFILRQTYALPGGPDVVIVEIGGTVGDIEGLPFCEAVHELTLELGKARALCLHLTYLPFLKSSGEFKTKPTQHSVKELRAAGLHPDIMILRCEKPVPADTVEKIGKYCGVRADSIFTSPDQPNIYTLPEHFHREKLVDRVCEILEIPDRPIDIKPIVAFTRAIENLQKTVNIAVVGKYVNQVKKKSRGDCGESSGDIYLESYKSVQEALCHAGVHLKHRANVKYLEYDELSDETMAARLAEFDGVLVPGGFGGRGMDELVNIIGHVRENRVPFFGICLGLQLAVIEYARRVLKIEGANSVEFDPDCWKTGSDVIYLMNRWYEYQTAEIVTRDKDTDLGGTLRLGLKPCLLAPDTRAHAIYRGTYSKAAKNKDANYHYPEVSIRDSPKVYPASIHTMINKESVLETEEDVKKRNLMTVWERHRHRYEINPAFHEALTSPKNPRDDRFVISGEAPRFTSPGEETPPHIAEIMELKNHPWFVGCQFHPEFLSRPVRPHPLFLGFVAAAIEFKEKKAGEKRES
jgi:CTP synthase